MEIEIYTRDGTLLVDLFGPPETAEYAETRLPDQARLIYKSSRLREAFGEPEVLNLVLLFGPGVATGIVANWLYDKLKRRKVDRLVIERTIVELDAGEIKRVIEEKLLSERV